MKYYYINLKDSIDRKLSMEKMLSNLNLDYERFDAVNMTECKDFTYHTKTHGSVKYNPKNNIGQLGCMLSHFSIIEQNKDNEKPFVILEDDIDDEFFTKQWLTEFYRQVNLLLSEKTNVLIIRPMTNCGNNKNTIPRCISNPNHFIYKKNEYSSKLIKEHLIDIHDMVFGKVYQFLKLPIVIDVKKHDSPGLATPFCYIHNAKKLYNNLIKCINIDHQTGYIEKFTPIDRIYTTMIDGSYHCSSHFLRRRYINSDIGYIERGLDGNEK